MSDVILELSGLTVSYGSELVARSVDLTVHAGEIVGLVGASGSGKSTLLQAILPLNERNIRIHSGSVIVCGEEISKLSLPARRKLAGSQIGIVMQNPGASFNMTRTFGKQFAETLKSNGRWNAEHTRNEIRALFQQLNLPAADEIMSGYPCRMSGGMNQRISIALTMLQQPKLLLADEPTSALDMEAQHLVIEQLLRLREHENHATLLVTHNLGVAAKLCDRIAIMKEGRIIEQGDIFQVLQAPEHEYTKSLLSAVPAYQYQPVITNRI